MKCTNKKTQKNIGKPDLAKGEEPMLNEKIKTFERRTKTETKIKYSGQHSGKFSVKLGQNNL